MSFSKKQSSNDGSRSDPNAVSPDQPAGSGGGGPSGMNVDNHPLEESSAVVDEIHNSDSRVGNSSRATSLLSTQHQVENQMMMNSSRVKRPTSGD